MKFVACVLASLAVASGVSVEHEVLNHMESLVHVSPRFSELKAATHLALAKEAEATSKGHGTGRNPMSEVAAMTDMMLIQCEHELTTMQVEHTRYHGECKKKTAQYSTTVAEKKRSADGNFKRADQYQTKWFSMLNKLPELDKAMSKTAQCIKTEDDKLDAAQSARTLAHKAYLKTLNDHAKALEDVRNIRLILQNSKLDDRSNKAATVSAGTKTTAKATGTFLEDAADSLISLKADADPRLHSLIQLAHAALTSQSQSGMDTIYALIYKTRDALLESRNKLVKEEEAAVGNWRTSKIAHKNDINDLHILKANYYSQSGVVRKEIGSLKKNEGTYKIKMAQDRKVQEDNQIMKDFLVVACAEDQRVYSRNYASKLNEKAALLQVQKKLVSLKWSTKVYAAIEPVSEGIAYLKGEYNFRSNLGRYISVHGSKVSCAPSTTVHTATTFHLALQPDDLSYLIFVKDSKGKKLYLTEDEKNNVGVQFEPTKGSRWNFHFLADTLSFNIRNQRSDMDLYVDSKTGFAVNTLRQTEDGRSQFKIERPGYSEVGCFKNKIGQQLSHYAGSFNDLNTEKCSSLCPSEQYKFFGLTEGKQCFCGGDFAQDKAAYTDCGYICPGRGGDSCGGKFRTIVYRNTPAPKPIIVEAAKGITSSAGGSHCAREHSGKTCSCTGIVSYGAKGKFYQRRVKGSTHCSNGAFGDPIVGTVKDCFCKSDASQKKL
mmetsp:Transcript_16854/g.23681  ORF Transcript_16854/g.23681 Transcript_16854/m.23681 type:complete len:716 (-) Transcript_16854:396-2543(-)|eukprot:CAMPEP_0175099710 /NCGR_PEP_ID=MMETSP0086_2-20121207/6618_1 /TAXON_ID=136419 /ORGANISM="Unknown Unknown, Strain D1" /LENGTH=715 /DNA_ID=CAMNT_0016373611 /DNA_START=36 /DNA_END=2183 /DNA_ORIENTATION=+